MTTSCLVYFFATTFVKNSEKRRKRVRVDIISTHKVELCLLCGYTCYRNNLGTTLRQGIVTNMVKKKVM